MSPRPLRILVFTTLYPGAADPLHGVFVENRLRQLIGSGEIEARVVAPVPWFPLKAEAFGRYGVFARAPQAEERHGVSIAHPRYLALPKIGWTRVPGRLARAGLRAARRLQAEGFDFDLIDAHYFYPDGVAAAHVARELGKPVVITARGTDLNVIARAPRPRAQVLAAARIAGGLIAVSQALAGVLAELGADPAKVRVLPNGVDGAVFRAAPDRAAVRAELGVAGPLILSVGRLVRLKGHELLVRALAELPGATLVLLGEGPERAALESLARTAGVPDRVRLLGRRPQAELARWYAAADVVALASDNEGCPNAILESLACGTPVVASAVGGIPELVTEDVAGILVPERTPAGFAAALRRALARERNEAGVLAYARRFGWDATTRGQLELFRTLVA
jgi:glycosyltransferase involved in cell wall biosynthesis